MDKISDKINKSNIINPAIIKNKELSFAYSLYNYS